MKIKFNNLHDIHKKNEYKFIKSLRTSIRNSSFIGGSEVIKFENNFKKLNQSKFCISCGNGSDALVIAIKALGIKPGDEVITTALSWIATSAAITTAGGRVVFCDIGESGFNIDAELIKKKISKRTIGIIPVHLYGYPADMEKIMKIAKEYKLWIIEDCAQAHLAEIEGKKVGNFGSFGTFSFFPGKNLGALGDAGCLVTNNKKLAERARLIANHGGKGMHLLEGLNSRMDFIQAGFLNIKIKDIKEQTIQRLKNAKIYDVALSNLSTLRIPKIEKKYKAVYHQYTIRTKKRNELKFFLEKNGIEVQIHYKQTLVEMKAYKYLNLNIKNNFLQSYKVVREILCLPISPDKTNKQIKYIGKMIKKFFDKNKK
jgi:dTDP-4-amino-4,6-dideoxygalactose transaminase